MKKFIQYFIIVVLFSVSKLPASSITDESKEIFLKSLQRSLQKDTNIVQLENTNYNVISQSFKSFRKKHTNYLDELEAIRWIEVNRNLDVNIYPTKHEGGTYYVRIVGGKKEFELIIK